MNVDKKNILIVEDDVISSSYLCGLLEEANYNVLDIVSKGKDAIRVAELLSPDLILMDIILKDDISGCEAALKINQKNPDISIIFLTAHVDNKILEYAKKSNACAYLMKPYQDNEILATIYLAIDRKDSKFKSTKVNCVELKDGYSFNTKTLILYKDEEHIPLTYSKTKLIEILVKNIDVVVSYSQITSFIWGEYREASTLRSLVYRTKQAVGYDLIINVSGVGYSIKSK